MRRLDYLLAATAACAAFASPPATDAACLAADDLGPHVGRCDGEKLEMEPGSRLKPTAICRRINATCACGDAPRLDRAAARAVAPRGERVCAVVRTYPSHAFKIGALLQTLHATATAAGLALEARLLITDASASKQDQARNPEIGDCFARQVAAEKARAAAWSGISYSVHVQRPHAHAYRMPRGVPEWGYIQTDLELLALRRRGGCDYVLVTNGDNVYDVDFAPRMLAALDATPGAAAAASDYYCHLKHMGHPVAFVQRNIDLANMLVRASYFETTNATFVVGDLDRNPESLTWKDVHQSDGRFAEMLQERAGGAIVHELLFYHF